MIKNSNKVTPIGDRILVKPVERKETTTGGIYLPESQQKQIPEGIIISKGAKVSDELNIGDKVRWLMVMADEIEFTHEDKFHLVIQETSIIAKLEDVSKNTLIQKG